MTGDKPRILVVDDEAAIRRLLQAHLEHEGFGVACCAGAAEAWGLLKARRFDAILLDNGMPDVMGIAALPKILELTKAPVILITGFGSDDTVKDALLLGASEVMFKPFDMDRLVGTLRGLIAKRRRD